MAIFEDAGVPFDAMVLVVGTKDTASEDLPRLIIIYPKGEQVANIISNTKPIPRSFLAGRPSCLMVKV